MILRNVELQDIRQSYDLLVAAVGFEARATAVSQRLIGKFAYGCAVGFDHNHECSYVSNRAWFADQGFNVIADVSTDSFAEVFIAEVDRCRSRFIELDSGRTFSVAFDISCLDRRRLAELIHWARTQKHLPISIDFWYCIGAFVPPVLSIGRNEIAGPIHKRFAGRFTEPGRPLALIAGLGYELGRVMGAAEYLQASRIITFLPESPIAEYEHEVLSANATMLAEIESRQILRYPVGDPERTIAMIDSTIRGLAQRYNVVLLPGGPKIFALCSLVAQTLHKEAAVWRVSSGSSIRAREVLPSQYIVGLRWAERSGIDTDLAEPDELELHI